MKKARDSRVLRAYEAVAPAYDDFTALYGYEGWLTDLSVALEKCGLRGNRLLHVACDTEVTDGLDRSGLECVEVYGHGLDGIPLQPLDPAAHTKALHVARRA
jgi:hypothetical protein